MVLHITVHTEGAKAGRPKQTRKHVNTHTCIDERQTFQAVLEGQAIWIFLSLFRRQFLLGKYLLLEILACILERVRLHSCPTWTVHTKRHKSTRDKEREVPIKEPLGTQRSLFVVRGFAQKSSHGNNSWSRSDTTRKCVTRTKNNIEAKYIWKR